MNGIIIAFRSDEARRKTAALVESCGYGACFCCRAGAQVLREVQRAGGGVVICGFQLTDMTADELERNLEGMALVLAIAVPGKLALLEEPGIRRMESPVSRSGFQATLEALVMEEETRRRAVLPKRSDADAELVARAKKALMRMGLTEDAAHTFLQQTSMRNRCRMAQTAKAVIERRIRP